MKRNTIIALTALALTVSLLSGCGKNNDTKTAQVTPTISATGLPSEEATPTSAEPQISEQTDPDEAAVAGEGSNLTTYGGSLTIDEAATVCQVGTPVTFQQDGKDMYSLTIDSITTTDDRSEYDTTQPAAVVAISYTFTNIASPDPMLIDQYSFQLADADSKAGMEYHLQVDGAVPAIEPVTAGGTASGIFYFSLEAPSANVTLVYHELQFGESQQYVWNVAL